MKKIVNYIKENWTIILAYSIGVLYIIQAVLLVIAMIDGNGISDTTLDSVRNSAVLVAGTI